MTEPGEPSAAGLTRVELGWLAVVALAWTLLLARAPATDGVDFVRFFGPHLEAGVRALRQGELPLWDPWVGLGRPLLADLQVPLLYPPTLLPCLLLGVSTGALVALGLHALLCLVGTTCLARQLGADRGPSLLAACAFLAGGGLVGRAQLGNFGYVQTLLWLPLVLHLALRLGERPSARGAAWLALALGLQTLSGHPQPTWLGGLAAGLLVLVRVPAGPGQARRVGVALCALAGAALLALGLSAVTALPFLELVGQGNRAASAASAAAFPLELAELGSLAVGPGLVRWLRWECDLHVGAAVAVAGVWHLLRARDATARALLTLALCAVALALGEATPLFRLFHALVPGVAGFRLHSRAADLVALAVVLGAARALSAPAQGGRGAGLGPAAMGLVFAVVALTRADRIPGLAAAAWVLLCAAPVVALERVSAPRARRALLAAVAAVWAIDAGGAALLLEGMYAPLEQAGPLRAREATLLQEPGVAAALRTAVAPLRVGLPREVVRENLGLVRPETSSWQGYVSLFLERPWVYVHARLGLEPPVGVNTFPASAVAAAGPFPFDTMNLAVGLDPATGRVAARDPGHDGWRWPAPAVAGQADPRAFLAPVAVRVSGLAGAIARERAGHDPHRVPLVEGPVDPVPLEAAPDAAWAGFTGRARIVRFAPARVEVEVEASRPALLVLSEAWYPGWTARTEAGARECVVANGWMRAVPVEAGARTVVIEYRSRWLGPGALLSLASAAALALVLVRTRRATPLSTTGGPGR